jgi:hypothetical protein
MKDFLGNALSVGDTVVGIVGRMDENQRFATNSLFSGSVVSFSEKRVLLLREDGKKVHRAPYKVAKVS